MNGKSLNNVFVINILDQKPIQIVVSDNTKKPIEKRLTNQSSSQVSKMLPKLSDLSQEQKPKAENNPSNLILEGSDTNPPKLHHKKYLTPENASKYQPQNKKLNITSFQQNSFNSSYDYSFYPDQGYFFYPRPYYNDVSQTQVDFQQGSFVPNMYPTNLYYSDNMSPYMYYNQPM